MASSLLKNCSNPHITRILIADSPDFSVEWPEGVPLPRPIDKKRSPIRYPYFIRRTKSKNLPVYNVAKHGGSLEMTTIHHVEGDPRVETEILLVADIVGFIVGTWEEFGSSVG